MLGRGRKKSYQSWTDNAELTPDEAAQRYAKIRGETDRKYGKKQKSGGDFLDLGIVQSFVPIDNGARIITDNGAMSIVFVTPNMVQVRVRPDRTFPKPFSYAIDEDFTQKSVPLKIDDNLSAISIDSGEMSCSVAKQPTSLTFLMKKSIVCADAVGGLAWRGKEVRWTRYLSKDEAGYGLGQRAAGLNLRGKSYALHNYDQVGYERGTDPVYYSIPFYLGLHPNYAMGILWDNPSEGSVSLGSEEHPDQMIFQSTEGELRFYLIVHEDPAVVLQQYMELTGKPPLPPLWAFGYHQSRWGYPSSNKFREIANEFRQRQIPCDVLHYDIDYMEGYRIFTWNQESFRDLPRLLNDLKQQGFRSIAILDPGIKADSNYPAFQSGFERGVFHHYPDGDLFLAPVWAGESAFPDFTNPEARAWWAEQVAELLRQVPFDGLWNDMNEPTVFLPEGAGTIPDYVPANWEGHIGSHRGGAHNVYGMQMARSTRMGITQAYPNKRPFTLTRAAYAGAQRYTTSWTGDNASTWDQLRLSISMLLNLGISGMYFTGPDIGGFFGESSPELYARWIQLGSVLPFCRTHSAKDTPDQEPWSFGEKVEKIARKYLRLRYQLLPYIYASYARAIKDGVPMIRPTFLLDRKDERLYGQDDVFMVGENLLVAPVLQEGATSKTFFLPKGVWFDYWTRQRAIGGREITVEAPLNQMPMFVLAGATLPHWEAQQYVGEKEREEFHLVAYLGNRETIIYEDSGEGLDYQDGDFCWWYFTCEMLPQNQYVFKSHVAGNYQPTYKQIRLEFVGIPSEPEMVLVDDDLAPVWYYDNGTVEVLASPFNVVKIIGKPDSTYNAQTVISRSDDLIF